MANVILCAVDESDAAWPVLDTGVWLADALRADLVVVHVAGGERDAASGLIGEVRARLGERSADVRLITGVPVEAIQAVADEERPEFLVVGSRGRGRLRAAVLGSVSRELVSQARHPVVVVPPGAVPPTAEAAAPGRASVVCGVDGSDEALAGAVFGGQLARRLSLRPVVVHARQNVRAALSYPRARSETPPVTGQADSVDKIADDVLQRAVEAAGEGATGVLEPGPPVEVLESVADREAAQLIVITARGDGGVRATLLGSVAAELTAGATRPVVVLSEAAAGTAPA
jgi:nucleotide-binding universal stress UspA family protein